MIFIYFLILSEPANVPWVNVAGYGKRAVVVKWDPARGDKDAYFVDLYAEDELIHSVNTSVVDNVLDDAEVIIDHLNYDFQYDAIVKTHSHALNSTGTRSSGHSRESEQSEILVIISRFRSTMIVVLKLSFV